MTVRGRLTLWHSGLLTALVLAFAAASYSFLRRTELARLDSMLHEQSEIVAQSMRAAHVGASGVVADTAVLLSALHDLRARGLRAWIIDPRGTLVASTAMVHEGEGDAEERAVLGDTVPTGAVRDAAAAARGEPRTVATLSGGALVYAAPVPADIGAGTVVVAHSLRDLDALLSEARRAAVVAVVLAMLLSLAAGYLLARQSLAPVADMSARANQIGAANLHDRLPVANPHDELGALAATFNALLDRVTNAFDQQRRFMADASHELRTPVAIMRGEADVALASPTRTREEYRDAMMIVRDAAERLTRAVNDVFLLARVDAGQVPLSPVPLYIDEIVTERCRAMRSLAALRRIELGIDVPGEIPYVGDELLLERLVMNLLDNAIKYADDASVVGVRLTREPSAFLLTVTNTGTAIPAAARPHLFDRFYRADPSRTRPNIESGTGSGGGLGLAIARWIAEVHGGTLASAGASDSRTTFALRLPLAPVLSA